MWKLAVIACMFSMPFLSKGSSISSDAVCSDCKDAVKGLQKLVNEKKLLMLSEKFINQNLCDYMGEFKKQCTDYVELYLPEIQQMIAKQLDPQQVCGSLQLCPSQLTTVLAQMRLEKSPLFKTASGLSRSTDCVLCKSVFTDLQVIDRDPKFEADVETFVKKELCARLSKEYDTECTDSVDNYGSFLFIMLAGQLDPQARCQSLGFCSASPTHQSSVGHSHLNTQSAVPGPRLTTECILCEFFMRELDNLLAKNATKSEIIFGVDKVCHLLPSTVGKECVDFVTEYGKAILQLLLAEVQPTEVCTTLGLCSKALETGPTALHGALILRASALDTDPTCETCQLVVQYARSMLEKNSTEAEIQQALDKVCNFLPSSYQTECTSIVTTYLPILIKLIEQEMTPNEVCVEIGLCAKAHQEQAKKQKALHLVGAKECSWGPTHWCASPDNARKCNAVEYCQKHDWAQFRAARGNDRL